MRPYNVFANRTATVVAGTVTATALNVLYYLLYGASFLAPARNLTD